MAGKKDFSLELRAQALGLSLTGLEEQLTSQFQEAIRDTVNAAYASIVAKSQAQLGVLSREYLKGLELQVLGNNQYLIILEGDFSNALERGIPQHDMRETMLNSKALVSQGPRQGLPWVQRGKKGQRYAYVPFPKNPNSKSSPETVRIGGIIKGFTARNAGGRMQKLTSIFRDGAGNPLEGKVATIKDTGIRDLDNLIKYQKTNRNAKTGKSSVQSTYVNFRTISDNSPKGKWMNPGRPALDAFKDAEDLVTRELDLILKYFLG